MDKLTTHKLPYRTAQQRVYVQKVADAGQEMICKVTVSWGQDLGEHPDFEDRKYLAFTGIMWDADKSEHNAPFIRYLFRDEIKDRVPELAPYTKWNHWTEIGGVVSPEYTAINVGSWAYDPAGAVGTGLTSENIARNACLWPDATLEQLMDKEAVIAHIKSLVPALRRVVTGVFGFEW